MDEKVVVFCRKPSERLRYTVDLVFSRMMGCSAIVLSDIGEISCHTGPLVIYGDEPGDRGVFIASAGLMEEKGIRPMVPDVAGYEGKVVLFPVAHSRSSLSFDIFSAVFYMVSRYEEHLPAERDRYGRYKASNSIAVKNDFLSIPVVHLWAEILRGILEKEYPRTRFQSPRYAFIPTIDVDHAWSYLGRSPLRTLGSVTRDLLSGKLHEVLTRFKVLSGREKDPFDTYSMIAELHAGLPEAARWFILFACYGGADNNVSITGKRFMELIRQLDREGRVGVHPSLRSASGPGILDREVLGLADVLRRPVTDSRQHFLRLDLPNTYRRLASAGIGHDYSLGYPEHPGFRAGIAVPFPFYDLEAERTTGLMIHPAILMDVTLKDYLRLTPQQSIETIRGFITILQETGGEFVTIWHNESLCDSGPWRGWLDVYRRMVELARPVE